MALATEKLYYRRSGTTYSINLYTATSDVGSEYIALKHANGLRYVKIVAVGDSLASYLRVQKGGTTKAIASTAIAYVGVWTLSGSGERSTNGNGWTSVTYTFDYNRVYSQGLPYNLEVMGYFHSEPSAQNPEPPTEGYCEYKIDGTSYSVHSTQAQYHRLSSGSHTIEYYGVSSRYHNDYSYGRRVV